MTKISRLKALSSEKKILDYQTKGAADRLGMKVVVELTDAGDASNYVFERIFASLTRPFDQRTPLRLLNAILRTHRIPFWQCDEHSASQCFFRSGIDRINIHT
jgi:hypothetical protein